MSEGEPKEKRKRQRLSLVCLHCKKRKIKCDKLKPTCSNCQRFGVECNYELPHWVNSSIGKKSVTTSVSSSEAYKHKSRDDLLQEIEQLRGKLNKSSPNTPNGYYNQPQDDYFTSSINFGNNSNDIIDLYESYNTLSMKHSSHEEHKPLNPMAINKMDHYLAFFFCYMFLKIKMTPASVFEMFKETWNSKHPDGSSKWLYMLDTKNSDSDLKDAIDRIVLDRSHLSHSNIFPFLNMKDSNQEEVDLLIKSIESTLPSKSYAENYLDFFFHFIWISKPFIDEETFKKDVTRIISFDDETKRPKITFSQRSDFATIATLLIVLRYSSVAISVIDDDELPSLLQPLKQNPVSVKAISVAQMSLSMYKILKKTTIHVIQSLLYLRCYFKDCPEDGDSLTLSQSQLLFGFIVQSAIAMGLHRDPSNHSQVAKDIAEVNLRRRLWHSIKEIDTETSLLAGTLSVLPHHLLVDVKLPSIISIDTIQHAQVKELEMKKPLFDIYEKLCFAINNMQYKPTLTKINSLIDQSRLYVDSHYSLNSLSNLHELSCGTRIFRATTFKNMKIIQKHLIQLSLEITLYYALCLHYEANVHLDATLYKLFLKKALLSSSAVLDLSSSYIAGGFGKYFKAIHTNFALFPLMITACYRAANTFMALLLRVYHAQDLLESNYVSSNDAELKNKALDQFAKKLSKKLEKVLYLNKKKFGTKYYQSLKMLGCGKYSFVLLQRDKFKIMNKIIKFLESDEKSSIGDDIALNGSKRDEIKKHFQQNKSLITVSSEWMQLNNTANWTASNNNGDSNEDQMFEGENETIMNIHNANLLVDFKEKEIKFYTNLLNSNALNKTDQTINSSSADSTPTEVYKNDIYQKIFDFDAEHLGDLTPQITNVFKAATQNGNSQNNFQGDGLLGDIFDQIMGTNVNVDDVFSF